MTLFSRCIILFFVFLNLAVFSTQAEFKKASDTATVSDTGLSIAKKAIYDSLKRQDSYQKGRYLAYPSSLDSVFNFTTIRPFQVQKSDFVGLSEVASGFPSVVRVPSALSSSRNRYMLYGFPSLPSGIFLDGNSFAEYPNAIKGIDNVYSTNLDELTIASPFGISSKNQPIGLVTPQTDALWENGVFLENLLGLRFSRPLTKKIDLAVFSNFRYMAPYHYRTANDIWTLYTSFPNDTTTLNFGGRNPLANETNMTIRLGSRIGQTGTASLAYSYEDSKTEQAVSLPDSTKTVSTLQWQPMFYHANTVRAQIRAVAIQEYFVNADLHVNIGGHTTKIPVVNSALFHDYAGNANGYCLGFEQYRGFGADTLSLKIKGLRNQQQRYDESMAGSTTGDMRVAYRRQFVFKKLTGTVSADLGGAIAKEQGMPQTTVSVGSADAVVKFENKKLHIFARKDLLPYVVRYDSATNDNSPYNTPFETYGVDAFVAEGKMGVSVGLYAVQGIDSMQAQRLWPSQTMPYAPPSYSLVITPMIARIGGLAIQSRCMLSDKKPYVKSQTVLNYESNYFFIREHIVSELVLDYWSKRDAVSYGGMSTWNRDLVNMSFKMSMHISQFSLFYKIDNILNRKYAYVPGYFMPGLTFRWGFQWLIDG